jgi:hypothetical protein
MVSFAALWGVIGLTAVAVSLALRHTLRLERELLDASDGLEVGSEVAPVRLPDLDGRSRNLLPAAGRRLALAFLSPACSACSQVSRIISALPDVEGTDVIAVCQASAAATRRYAERERLFVPVVPDPDGAATRALQVSGIPFVILLDRQGRVERKGVPASYRDMLELVGGGAGSKPQPRELALAGAGADR